MIEDTIFYFDNFGEENTQKVCERVIMRLKKGDIKELAIASNSGNTALIFAKNITHVFPNIKIFCVSEPVSPWAEHSRISKDNRKELNKLGVEIIDYAPYTFFTLSENIHGLVDLMDIVSNILRMIGGQGLKTAVEIGLMLTNCGKVKSGNFIISVGGTGEGADTSIVMKTAFSFDLFAKDPNRRIEVREILCTPIKKKWWR